jgi:hypothetical protein
MSEITEQEKGTASKADEQDLNPSAKSIWDEINEIMKGVPDEVLSRLPADGAERHDHHLRGAHKRHRQDS